MVWVDHEPGDPYPETDTDWAAVDALTDEQVHAAALADPDAQPIPRGTDEDLAKIGLHRIVNTHRLRRRLGMTQEAFAETYRIPVGTLRDWEQGRKIPDATARAYLTVIARNPEAVAEWLRAA
jgi:putative transcriptional regulator